MRELPMLFSTEMVQAILDGRKTMTRRLVKPQPIWKEKDNTSLSCAGWSWERKKNYVAMDSWPFAESFARELVKHCPYEIGDRLYVRETWQNFCLNRNTMPNCFAGHSEYCFKASLNDATYGCCREGGCKKWHPSIHMPKSAARIWLEVTNIRVEMLQDITEEDAISEGLRIGIGGQPYFSCRDAFIALWNNLNAKRGYGWDLNPFCWVIEFRRVV